VFYSGGGGASGDSVSGESTASGRTARAVAGATNRGAGGGAGGGGGGFNGGSGVVILRHLTADGTITIGAGLTGSTATDGSYKVTTITAGSGNVSWA